MALSKTASLTYVQNEQESTSHYSFAGSLAAVGTFAAAIQPYSCAAITAFSYTEENTEPTGLTPASGNEALNFQLIVSMRKPAQTQTVQINIPAPDPAIFDQVEGVGYRLKKTVGDAIAAAYSTLMGQTYVFSRGWLTT